MDCQQSASTDLRTFGHQQDLWAEEHSARAVQRLFVLGEMTAGIAHDFRNILATIDSGLRLAERTVSDPDSTRTFISGVREAVTRGLGLTSQLLSFARQRALPIAAADVNALLSNLELFLKYGAGSAACLELQLSANIPKCLVDPSQFAAAILNLVINARDAMPAGGTIEIATAQRRLQASPPGPESAAVYVRVRVRDNGMGMTADVAQRIFDPFFTTKGDNGTGLGMPQVYAFMRNLGGHLALKSEVGRGTTFDLFFRAVEAEGTLA